MTRQRGRFRMVATLVAMVPTLAVAADYAATYSAAPFRICPGKEITVPVKVTNTGELPWEVTAGKPTGDPRFFFTGDFPYLTYHLEDTKTGITTYDVSPTYLPQSVAPGQTITVDMRIVPPSRNSGPYRVHWDMGILPGLFSQEYGVPTGVVALQSASWLTCLGDRVFRIPSRHIIAVTTLIFDGPDVVEPDKTYALSGMEFGTAPGSLTLAAAGFVGGPLQLQIVSWTDTTIGFSVPHRCGEVDQDADIQLTTASGMKTHLPVRFKAKRARRAVDQDHVQVVGCQSPGSGRHRCNSVGTGPIGAADLSLEKSAGVTAQHQSLLANQSATDEFFVPLLNGWEIVTVAMCLEEEWMVPGVICSSGPGHPLQEHHTADRVFVDWRTGIPLDAIGYLGVVIIEGPCNTPHQ